MDVNRPQRIRSEAIMNGKNAVTSSSASGDSPMRTIFVVLRTLAVLATAYFGYILILEFMAY